MTENPTDFIEQQKKMKTKYWGWLDTTFSCPIRYWFLESAYTDINLQSANLAEAIVSLFTTCHTKLSIWAEVSDQTGYS